MSVDVEDDTAWQAAVVEAREWMARGFSVQISAWTVYMSRLDVPADVYHRLLTLEAEAETRSLAERFTG